MAPPSLTGNSDGGGQKLESVLERLGFSEYLSLFQVCNIVSLNIMMSPLVQIIIAQKNEIDLDALQLMSEKEFSEIGLPTVC